MAKREYELDVSKFTLEATLCSLVILLLLLTSVRWEDEFTVMNGLRIVIFISALYVVYSLVVKHLTMAKAITKLVNECDVPKALERSLTLRAEVIRNLEIDKIERLRKLYREGQSTDTINAETEKMDAKIKEQNGYAANVIEAARELHITNRGAIDAYMQPKKASAAS